MGVSILNLLLVFVAASTCRSLPAFNEAYAKAVNQGAPAAQRERSFEQALRACPGDADVYAAFTAFLVTSRQFEKALKTADDGLRAAPGNPELTLQKGAALLSLGRAKQSLLYLRQVPPSGQSQFYIGMAHRQLGNHSDAEKAFAEAWRLGYQEPYVLYSMVEEDRALGDKPSGMRHFQLFLSKFPDSAWMHILLGDAYLAQKEDAEARKEYQQAAKLAPDLIDAHYRLGYMAFQAGDNVEAEGEFNKEVRLNPNFADAHLYLGETLIRLGEQDKALPHLRLALNLDPHSDIAYHRLATVLTDNSQLPEAAEVLKRGEVQFPTDPTFPAQLARLFTRLNRPQEAQAAAARARDLAAAKLKQQEVRVRQ